MGKERMAMGFNSWVEAGLAAANKGILEEHDFRPYSPYGEGTDEVTQGIIILLENCKFER